MHVRPVSKKATTMEDWGIYEDSWIGLMVFIIISIIVPQKL